MSAKPFALMVAGPNGSGKTTLTEELRRRGVDLGHYINADEIASALTGPYPERVAAAQVEAEAQRQSCLADGVSFSFETVMSHPSKVRLLEQARDSGFVTALYFVSTESPDLNVARVKQRVALGGHDVPRERIIARYHRTMQLLPQAIAAADQVVLFDNSTRASEADPVILRPFLLLSRTAPASVHIEEPVPDWARPVIQSISPLSLWRN